MKTRYLLILPAVTALLGACSEDFLDKKPLVNTAAETYYSNDTEVNTAVLGAYSVMQQENIQVGPIMILGDDCSDDFDLGNSKSEAYSWLGSSAKACQQFNLAANNGQSGGLWNLAWTAIGRATQIIDRVKDKENIKNKDQYLGEAHFIRAYFYFFLTRQYGRMPIVDHILSFDEYYMPRATIEQTWAHIESDLKQAATLLPKKAEYDAADMGRATSGAAKAFLGKVYIYQGKFQEAYDILGEVIKSNEYKLEPNYADVFELDHENGVESIFEVQFAISGTGWSDSNEGWLLSFYEHDADPDDPVKWHNGWSMHCPTQDLVDEFEEGDPRLGATVIFPNEFFDGRINKNVASSTGYQAKKWYIPYEQRSQTDQSDCPKNYIFIRYADVLLYMAEAANEIGKPTEALGYLKQVRDRARASATDPNTLPEVTTTDKTALRESIWHERRVELAGEGQRFWDIARQGRAGSLLRAYSTKYNSIKGKDFKDGINEVFPIPTSAITASNNTMDQNTGW